MKDDSQREILDDLYAAPGCGPSCDDVLEMVRTHRRNKRRLRAAVVMTLAVAIFAVVTTFQKQPQPVPILAKAEEAKLDVIDDDELLDMMNGQPAAIATLPDGSKRLLLLVGPSR